MDPSDTAKADDPSSIRPPRKGDAAAVHRLVIESQVLDRNSLYAYLLVCTHFAATSAVAEKAGEVVGFVSAYFLPERLQTLFVWQMAVSPEARGERLAQRMLTAILERPRTAGAEFIETTISPSNGASWAVFRSFAKALGAPTEESALFGATDFAEEDHEEERLLRVGPLPRSRRSNS